MNLEAEYRGYIEDLAGVGPTFEPVDHKRSGKLPLYLRHYYRIMRTRLFGRQVLLAFQNPDAHSATPAHYAKHHGILQSMLADEVVLVLPRIASYGRQQLVRRGVPFVVPHRQAFLPPMMVDFHEHFLREARQPGGLLTAASQVVLLRQILGRPTEGLSLCELARELGYSAMTLSNVRGELESLKLCKPLQKGRHTHLLFEAPSRTLWEQAKPHLRNPVKARRWVRWAGAETHGLQAGLTALEALSMTSDDEIPTYAVRAAEYRVLQEKDRLVGCRGPEEAQACLECWSYDPRLLSGGPTVDRLSLYLSLRGTHDERVMKELETLLEAMPW